MIDHARASDLPAIAALQTASWRAAYRGLLPDTFLDERVPGIMARKWAALPGASWIVLVARGEGGSRPTLQGLAGFAALDMDHAGGPYLDNLHVAPAAQRAGVGRALMAALGAQVAARGGASIRLTVIARNARARAFYAALGGVEGAEQDEDLYGEPVRTFPVGWSDLQALSAAAGR